MGLCVELPIGELVQRRPARGRGGALGLKAAALGLKADEGGAAFGVTSAPLRPPGRGRGTGTGAGFAG